MSVSTVIITNGVVVSISMLLFPVQCVIHLSRDLYHGDTKRNVLLRLDRYRAVIPGVDDCKISWRKIMFF